MSMSLALQSRGVRHCAFADHSLRYFEGMASPLGVIARRANRDTGQFISICLRCIFPGWTRIKNTIPANQYITTQE